MLQDRFRTRVLLTGFKPFPKNPVNATETLVPVLRAAAQRAFPDVRFDAAILPTEWHVAPARMQHLLAETQPNIALSFGISGRATRLTIETRGLNWRRESEDAAGVEMKKGRFTADGRLEVLGRLEPGHFFGETGIATGNPRNAHVIARSPLTCLLFAPAEPTRFVGRGAGAHPTDAVHTPEQDDESLGETTTRIDVSSVIDRKIAAIAAYRSQFAFDPDAIPRTLLLDLFGVEYFVRAQPARAIEASIS